VILFLDYDGVMHPDPCTDRARLFENAPRLERSLDAFPEVGVVLSTSWRNQRPVAELLAPLPEQLRRRVMGITPNFGEFAVEPQLVPYRRHAECVRWLQMHHLGDAPWVALDDRPAWFVPYCENLIQCHPVLGFDEVIGAHLSSHLTRARQRMTQELDVVLL
jgi:hypothetical protein